jgi:hypothetical protein
VAQRSAALALSPVALQATLVPAVDWSPVRAARLRAALNQAAAPVAAQALEAARERAITAR